VTKLRCLSSFHKQCSTAFYRFYLIVALDVWSNHVYNLTFEVIISTLPVSTMFTFEVIIHVCLFFS
jgi:uncharacterized protein YqhQ